MTTDEKTANFKTSCQSCIFAQWENEKQSGCDLDRLPKYIQLNKATFNQETKSFIINTICAACRGEQWGNTHLGENLIKEVEDEIKIGLDFIILVLHEDKEKIDKKLPDIIRKCKNQEKIKPRSINIILQHNSFNSSEIYQMMLDENDSDIKFNLVRILDLSHDESQCVDSGIKKCKSTYYAVFNLNDNIPINLITTVNELINIKLRNISMIAPYKNFSGLIAQTSLHRLFGGNKNLPIYEKIAEAAEFQNKKNYTYQWDELWNHHE